MASTFQNKQTKNKLIKNCGDVFENDISGGNRICRTTVRSKRVCFSGSFAIFQQT
jgi:hypothetical protein